MSSIATLQTASAFFKTQFADHVINLVPDLNPIMKDFPFVPASEKHGSVYIWPVILNQDQGFTCHGANDANLVFNDPSIHTAQQASITASTYTGRTFISLSTLSRATGSEKAFVDATSHYVEALMGGFSNMLEGIHWYGKKGLAKGTSDASNVTTNPTLSIAYAAAAPFLFLGAEGMPVDIYTDDGSGNPTFVKVLSTMISKVFIGSSTGLITNMDGGIFVTLASAAGLSTNTAYHIFRKGYRSLEHSGIVDILSNDTIFGIDASNFSLWRANRFAVGAALTYSNFSKAVAMGIGRGLSGPLMCYARANTLRSVFPDYQPLSDASSTKGSRRFQGAKDVSSLEHGTRDIKFIVDGVEATMKSSEFVKGGDMVCLDAATVLRIGSSGVTFNLPGLNIDGQSYFLPRQDISAAELRVYADESVVVEQPSKSLLLTSISAP